MNLTELMNKTKQVKFKNRKRVGRGPGSGNGKTSGRGHRGQNVRSGGKVRPGFEGGQMPLYRRLPKKGFKNARHKKEYFVVNVSTLMKSFEKDSTVDISSLEEKRILKNRGRMPVKILGQGELNIPLTVKAHAFSKSAEEKITKAGGKIEVV